MPNGDETNLWDATNEDGDVVGYEKGGKNFFNLRFKIMQINKQMGGGE